MITLHNYHNINSLHLLTGGVISADYLHSVFDIWRFLMLIRA